MGSKIPIFILVVVIILGGIIYLGSPQYQEPQESPQDQKSTSRKAEYEKLKTQEKLGIVQITQNPILGEYLTDKQGKTLYIFTQDTNLESVCTGECTVLWPPFIASDDEIITLEFYTDTLHKNLNLIEREDGTVQFAYISSPLYYYAQDIAPGNTTGHGLNNAWFVAAPELEP
jgi:predicted lipoprotein with Yx(FWY)xxD motif